MLPRVRKPEAREFDIVNKVIKRMKVYHKLYSLQIEVAYDRSGRFTLCVLSVGGHTALFWGACRIDSVDHDDKQRGRDIALAKAARMMVKDLM